jgi:hypothetical protein
VGLDLVIVHWEFDVMVIKDVAVVFYGKKTTARRSFASCAMDFTIRMPLLAASDPVDLRGGGR